MKYRFGEWLVGGYVRWSLFLSSYAPLLLIFGIRISAKSQAVAFWCFALSAVAVVNLLMLLNFAVAPKEVTVKTCQRGGSEIAGYVAAYLLPFLVVNDVNWQDLTAYVLFILFIGLAMTGDDILQVNPVLTALGLHLSTISTADGTRYHVVSRDRVEPGDIVRGRLILDRLLWGVK